MKAIGEMSAGELAALVYSYLKEHGIEVVLSGGACVTIYSQNKYIRLLPLLLKLAIIY